MFYIKMADLIIKINNKHQYLFHYCHDFIVLTQNNYDLDITVEDDEIETEKANSSNKKYSDGYLECICCYRKICLQLPKFNGFLLHASVVAIDGLAYAFLAKSGTGKTTHTLLLKSYLGEKMIFINGDKPIIRITDGIPRAYGTPWNGKERYGSNCSAPLKTLCFIERHDNNEVISIDKKNVLLRIIHQVLLNESQEYSEKTLDLLGYVIDYCSSYIIKCNKNIEAAVISYRTISN